MKYLDSVPLLNRPATGYDRFHRPFYISADPVLFPLILLTNATEDVTALPSGLTAVFLLFALMSASVLEPQLEDQRLCLLRMTRAGLC